MNTQRMMLFLVCLPAFLTRAEPIQNRREELTRMIERAVAWDIRWSPPGESQCPDIKAGIILPVDVLSSQSRGLAVLPEGRCLIRFSEDGERVQASLVAPYRPDLDSTAVLGSRFFNTTPVTETFKIRLRPGFKKCLLSSRTARSTST